MQLASTAGRSTNGQKLLAAIESKPGISKLELMEQGIRVDALSIQALASEGKIIVREGGYFPYKSEYLPNGRQQPPLKVWVDHSVIAAPEPEPEFWEEDEEVGSGLEVSAEKWTPIIKQPEVVKYDPAVDTPSSQEAVFEVAAPTVEAPRENYRAKNTARATSAKIKQARARADNALAQLLQLDRDFTAKEFFALAGLSSSYFTKNPGFKQIFSEARRKHQARLQGLIAQAKEGSISLVSDVVQHHEIVAVEVVAAPPVRSVLMELKRKRDWARAEAAQAREYLAQMEALVTGLDVTIAHWRE